MTTFPIARAGDKTLEIQGKMANRHGLIAGATGTGKTVTLRRMAEAFSSEGKWLVRQARVRGGVGFSWVFLVKRTDGCRLNIE